MSSSFPSFLPRHLLHGVGPLRRCSAVHVTRCFSFNGAAGRRVRTPLPCSAASIATPGNGNALHVGARFYVTRDMHDPSARAEEPELISLDCIEVITTTVETSGDAAETNTATTSSPTDTTAATATVTENASHFAVYDVHHHQHHKEQVGASADFTATAANTAPYSSDTSREAATAYCDVHDVDTFARSRIANFMRRMGHTKGDIFQVREVQETHASSGATHAVFVATCCVPLPPPHHSRMAEGVGESRKEAELLAAMHAERLCDALGVPLFRLRTAQQKHAEAVRAREGRYAPMPDDPVKPLGTPVPPPLRLLRTPPQPPPPSPSASLSGHEVHIVADSTAEKSEKQSHSSSSSTSAPASSQPATGVATEHKTNAATATRTPAETDSATSDQSSATSRPPETSPESTAAARAEDATEWPTSTATPFFTSDATRNETRCRDARLLFNTFVRPISDAAHAERVASYASTVVYPWESGWVEAPDAHATAPMRGEGRANAYAAVPSVTYDPTEGGMWQMVNDRNLRCSPTPQDALVLPYVFDGPHAVARLTDYYLQHGTTLGEHLTVRSVAAPGTQARQSEAELRLIGVTVAARGKSQTEEMAVGLAAMHAELLLDALGLPLFPADALRQSRHAAVVTGYGRWAMDPLNGATASPNLHDALPLPLKSQVGTDDVWLDASAPLQLHSKRTESERIVAAQNFIIHKSDCMLEVNPPNELLEEAYTMLREWQTHIARSRYTNLFVLFNMECNVYRATTLTPVPARFGLRGGNSVATTHEKAVRLCALNAMDTLASLGVPLCVDAEQERRYLQRRAALGHVLPNMLDGVKHLKGGIPYLPGSSRTKLTRNALAHLGPESTREKSGLPYIPTYLWEGQQTRMMPALVDYQHVTQLKVPQDYCLFSSSNDFAMNEAGNEAKICVCNYLEQCHAQRVRDLTTLLQKMAVKKFDYPYTPDSSSNDLGDAEDEVSRLASVIGSRTAAADRAVLRNDALLQTQLWAVLKYHTTSPSVYVTGYVSTVAVHSIAFLSIPVLQQRRSKGQVEDRRERREHEGAPTSDDVGAIAELEELLNGPDYVLAVGISLKRRDAVRACYVHAVNLLKRMGLDVLAKYTAGASRSRHVPNHEALSQYVSVDPPTVVLPFTHDGEVNTTPLEIPVSTLPAEQRPPLAVMHKLLKMYMEDARHVTPRRRPAAKRKTGFSRAAQGKW